MKIRNCYLLFIVLAAVITFGCKRRDKEIAGTSGPVLGSPQYTVGSDIASASGASTVASVMPLPAGALDGAKLFAANCSACHQLTGLGIPGAFPPLDGSAYVLSDNVDRMASIMLYGLMGPITVKGHQFASVMAPLGVTLNDDELAAVATYVRSAWSNKAGPVESKVFSEMRKKWGTRSAFAITELGEEK